jgi:hypothetical protein
MSETSSVQLSFTLLLCLIDLKAEQKERDDRVVISFWTDMSYPSFGVMLVGLAGGYGAGLLCWKCTQSWRDAVPTWADRRQQAI